MIHSNTTCRCRPGSPPGFCGGPQKLPRAFYGRPPPCAWPRPSVGSPPHGLAVTTHVLSPLGHPLGMFLQPFGNQSLDLPLIRTVTRFVMAAPTPAREAISLARVGRKGGRRLIVAAVDAANHFLSSKLNCLATTRARCDPASSDHAAASTFGCTAPTISCIYVDREAERTGAADLHPPLRRQRKQFRDRR
jgi:hypothetical protein